MAVVLLGLGAFLYFRFERDLDASVDQGLRSRAGDVTALVRQGRGSSIGEPGALAEQSESFAQILERDATVVDGTSVLGDTAVLALPDISRASSETIKVDRSGVIEPSEPVRLLATPVRAGDRRLIVVVGASLEDQKEALRSLLALLAIGGPIALLLASLAGYGVAAGALRPVDAMRRRAERIGDAEPGRRLPVAEARDEIRRLGETLNAMRARLEAALERERTFVSDASHEIRTPLAILKAEIELALTVGRTEAELRDALRSAGEETDRLAQLAEDLLVMARSDRGLLPVRPEPIAAADLLDAVKQRFARRARDQDRTLDTTAPEGLELTVDRLRTEQALGNAVDNALRHGQGSIRLTAGGRDGIAELCVTDEGTGFPESFRAQAFERFTRADDARARGGTGLGLAIVMAIVQAHGGSVHARNRASGGAEIRIELTTPPPAPGASWPGTASPHTPTSPVPGVSSRYPTP